MNNKDRKMLNNPEEGGNPFKFKQKQQKQNGLREEGISHSDDSDGADPEQKAAAAVNASYTPIQALVPNQKDWVIRARISKKY
jgi:hypothetical protein